MPEEPVQPTGQIAPPVTEPSGQIDPAEYYRMQDELRQAQGVFERMAPHAERIRKIVEDADAAAVFDRSYEAFENMRKGQEPQIPAELRPLYDKVNKLDQFAENFTKQQQEAIEAPQREMELQRQAWVASNIATAKRLSAEHPELQDYGGIAYEYMQRAAEAEGYKLTLEQVFKRDGKRFVKEVAPAPPPSLRADTGDIGIPGDSTPRRDDKTPVNVRDELIKRIKANGVTA